MRDLTPAEAAAQLTTSPPTVARALVGVAVGLVLVPLALLVTRAFEPWGAIAIPLAFLLAFGVVAVPVFLRRQRERWIVLHGTSAHGRVSSRRVLGRSAWGLAWLIVDVGFEVEVEGRGRVAASARVLLANDPRNLEALDGRNVRVYWHERYPTQAVPEDGLR